MHKVLDTIELKEYNKRVINYERNITVYEKIKSNKPKMSYQEYKAYKTSKGSK